MTTTDRIAADSDYTIDVTEDETTTGGRCFVARHPDLPGCTATGRTVQQAVDNLKDARELYLAGLRRRGLAIPLPRGPIGTR